MNIKTDATLVYQQSDGFTLTFNDNVLTATGDEDNTVCIPIAWPGLIVLGELLAAIGRNREFYGWLDQLILRVWCASPGAWLKSCTAIKTIAPMKKAAGGHHTTTATTSQNDRNFMAAGTLQVALERVFLQSLALVVAGLKKELSGTVMQ